MDTPFLTLHLEAIKASGLQGCFRGNKAQISKYLSTSVTTNQVFERT